MVAQQRVSLKNFAVTMRKAKGSFAQSVARFESRFGVVTDEVLSVLAQAAFLCWVNIELNQNLINICKAIGSGIPNSLYYHSQVSPEQWKSINTNVIGMQRWLGVKFPLPFGIDAKKVQEINHWLGEKSPGKEALVKLLLMR